MRHSILILATVALACGSGNNNTKTDAMTEEDVTQPDGASSDAGTDGPPYMGMDPTIVPGAPDKFLLAGTIVTPDEVIEGQVLVEAGVITCVEPGTACSAMAGAMGATIIDTKGVIAPGLIDTHNHILFDIFDNDDWVPSKLYTNHNQWPQEAKYGAMVDVKQCLANDSSKPTWCAMTPYGTTQGSLRCELDKWGELKGMIAGTTSIVGLPGTSSACFDTLSRSIDTLQNGGLGPDKVQTSALFPPSNCTGVCTNFANGTTDAFLAHVGEGIDQTAKNEWNAFQTCSMPQGCLLAPQTAITHGTAFGATEFQAMAMKGMKLTWSPASNVALYGQTTDIPAVLAANVPVALAPDWSMGGSQNMLDEMRFADNWDNTKWNDKLSPKDIVIMSTSTPALVVGMQARLGRIKVGYVADLFAVSGDPKKPYDAILASTPKEVALVMIGGKVLYGTDSIKAAGPAMPGCETIDICGKQKFLCVATTDMSNKFNQTYADIKNVLEKALVDVDTVTMSDGFNFAPLAPIVRCK